MPIDRRNLLGLGAATAAFGSVPALGQISSAKPGTVRDRLWAFCNPINADYYMVKKRSVISPVESALSLGIPNIMMVNQFPDPKITPDQDGFYLPWRSPLDLHAYPTHMLEQVVWSIVGAHGKTSAAERAEAMALARRTPNFSGMMMDDFVRPGRKMSLTVEQLQEVQRELKQPDKALDLYVTLYMASSGPKDQIQPFIAEHLKHIDVVTLWTWDHADLKHLEANLTKLEGLAPKSRKMLGCYTAALNSSAPRWTPLSIEAMRHQCETGLRWLQEGRIEGIIIYANFLDLKWDSIDWARDWVRRVGDLQIRA